MLVLRNLPLNAQEGYPNMKYYQFQIEAHSCSPAHSEHTFEITPNRSVVPGISPPFSSLMLLTQPCDFFTRYIVSANPVIFSLPPLLYHVELLHY